MGAPARLPPQQVLAGLALMLFSYSTFHHSAAQRAEGRQRLWDSHRRAKLMAHEAEAQVAARLQAGDGALAARKGAGPVPPTPVLLLDMTASGTGAEGGRAQQHKEQREGQREERTAASDGGGAGAAVDVHAGLAQLHRAEQQRARQVEVVVSQQKRAAEEELQQGGASGAGDRPPGPSEQQAFCDVHFGLRWLKDWNATRRELCLPWAPAAGAAKQAVRSSSLACRAVVDAHMPAASAPHVLCDATNLLLDPSKLVRVEEGALPWGAHALDRLRHHACAAVGGQLPSSWPRPLCDRSAAPSTLPAPPPRLPLPHADLQCLRPWGLGPGLPLARRASQALAFSSRRLLLTCCSRLPAAHRLLTARPPHAPGTPSPPAQQGGGCHSRSSAATTCATSWARRWAWRRCNGRPPPPRPPRSRCPRCW